MSDQSEGKPLAAYLAEAKRELRRDLKRLEKAPADDSMTPHIARLEPYQTLEIERMARQGMGLETIGARLRIPLDVWSMMIQVNPEIRDAYLQGAAAGVDLISEAGFQGARGGDASLIKFYLERFGGPQFKKQDSPQVVIQTGPVAVIDQKDIAARLERQRRLIDGTAIELQQAPDGQANGPQ